MDLIPLETIFAAVGSVFQVPILLWIFAGVIIGFIFGASPGLTATTGVAIATPLTFGVSFEVAMALLLGIYSAGYFAGSIPAILINTPGSPGNAATAVDGYKLARKGKADLAISLAVVASGFGAAFSIAALMIAAPNLANFALQFTSVEYFALGLFGLICVAAVSGGSPIKGIIAASFGMFLGTVGIDDVGGMMRYSMGVPELQGGIPLVPALIAFFAVAEMLQQASSKTGLGIAVAQTVHPIAKLPGIMMRHGWLLARSSITGTLIGILPGTGPTIASWIAYGQSGSAQAKDAEAGSIRGIIASESANNAVTGGALVPLLTLGIPGDTVTAVLIGALLIQGIDPGPFFIFENSDLFAQILVILFVAAGFTVIIGLAARRVLPKLLDVPIRIQLPVIAVLCATGGFAISHSPFEVGVIAVLGIIGYIFVRFGFPMAPIVIGLVLGPIIETNLRNGLTANDMDATVFVTRPISATLLAIIVLTLLWSFIRRRKRG
ncbi:tripartite tricarboxylate transporter permease [Roseobacter sp. N2S]|uniref:tripartite tricarboxylate transporter permease n=1 Tax=Roseobacter sp. N2S TaxID=2663844 RepID=UPI00285E138D|nr:tripartite tricarboxylate transporter permease [Roseobacter sp. N2S]MDR6266829.1 putative tricarboxylic transport membrane protein [Roseobacter sp. N2S]